LLASLADVGQQVPIVVVQEASASQHVVIDGYKRIRSLRRLGRDTVAASSWPGDQWHQLLGNKDLTEALLSRLRHQCQTIRINGPSLREPQG
jgi:hypothetical protein